METCPVCLEKLDNIDENCKVSCGHVFHVNCILHCASFKNSCPVCRNHLFESSPGAEKSESSPVMEIIVEEEEEINSISNAQREMRNYVARRNRLARSNEPIKKQREKLRLAKKEYQKCEKEMNLLWEKTCKQIWNGEEFKQKRNEVSCKRKKWKRLESIYENQTQEIIGEPPIIPRTSSEEQRWVQALIALHEDTLLDDLV